MSYYEVKLKELICVQVNVDVEVYLEMVRVLSRVMKQISQKSQKLVYDREQRKVWSGENIKILVRQTKILG